MSPDVRQVIAQGCRDISFSSR